MITYAVSLHLPDEVTEIITSAIKAVADVTGIRFILENKIPPHITVGAFHSAKKDEEKLLQMIKDFSAFQKPGDVVFKGTDSFNEKVLFLKPEKNNFLSKINQELHQVILPEFEKAENGYYLPEVWFPHITLATRLNQNLFKKAREAAEQITLPLEVHINELAVYRCSPFEEVMRCYLSDDFAGVE